MQNDEYIQRILITSEEGRKWARFVWGLVQDGKTRKKDDSNWKAKSNKRGSFPKVRKEIAKANYDWQIKKPYEILNLKVIFWKILKIRKFLK